MKSREGYRIEYDTMGEIAVPEDRLWGAQTQRSLQNFTIGKEKMPLEVVYALATVKKAAAVANAAMGKLENEVKDEIIAFCDEITGGKHNTEFVLSLWQTGSGTQSNMNVNEVVANGVNQRGRCRRIHPNDDVNKSQSSNDAFPSAMHIAAMKVVKLDLLPSLKRLQNTLEKLSTALSCIIKIGRTHMQDAVPLTLGQEIGGWTHIIMSAGEMIEATLPFLSRLPIGGTAVGTGLNAPVGFDEAVCKEISRETGFSFLPDENKFYGLSSKGALSFAHGALSTLAEGLYKIASDIRLLSSGPRCGIGELIIPENEPGSSIMPGKVNPTQCEALTMVCLRVMGNQTTVSMAASQGQLQLNVYMPVIIDCFLQSASLLAAAMDSLEKNCIRGIKPNEMRIQENLYRSLMLATGLSARLGYDNAAKIARLAYDENLSLKEASVRLNLLAEDEFDRLVRPEDMV